MFLFHKNQTKREAFGQMFTEMYPRMVRYASQLMGDGEEARDIVSEVMEQAWKHFDQLDEADRGGWIYTAVRNTCRNRLAPSCGYAITNISPIGKSPNNSASVPTR